MVTVKGHSITLRVTESPDDIQVTSENAENFGFTRIELSNCESFPQISCEHTGAQPGWKFPSSASKLPLPLLVGVLAAFTGLESIKLNPRNKERLTLLHCQQFHTAHSMVFLFRTRTRRIFLATRYAYVGGSLRYN